MKLHWIETDYDGQPAHRAEGRFGHYMVRLTAEGCRLVCFRVESDEIAGSLSPGIDRHFQVLKSLCRRLGFGDGRNKVMHRHSTGKH